MRTLPVLLFFLVSRVLRFGGLNLSTSEDEDRDVSSYERGKIGTLLQTSGHNMWHCFVGLASMMAVVRPRTSDPNSTRNVLLPWKQ